MATTQSSSTRYSPQDNRELAIKLADACVNPSYMAELWAVYFRRFEEVLAAERAIAAPVTRWGASSRRPQLMPIRKREFAASRPVSPVSLSPQRAEDFRHEAPRPEPEPFEHSHIPAKEAPPRSRPQVVSPGFRASLVQPSVSLRPFPLQRMGDPPPLALATRRLRQEAFRHF
jgi:hypothetical protein